MFQVLLQLQTCGLIVVQQKTDGGAIRQLLRPDCQSEHPISHDMLAADLALTKLKKYV